MMKTTPRERHRTGTQKYDQNEKGGPIPWHPALGETPCDEVRKRRQREGKDPDERIGKSCEGTLGVK